MDGRNSCGRKISLLIEPSEAPPTSAAPPSLGSRTWSHTSTASRTSSYVSTPPLLVRSNSTDSDYMMQTPSPTTPDFSNFENLNNPNDAKANLSPGAFVASQNPLFPAAPAYPAPPQSNSWAYPPPVPAPGSLPQQHQTPQVFRSSLSPAASDNRVSNSTATKPAKKNQYPCPLARQYNCNDYFTTSGHAARHAKKHTGKKDAFCPECNKAFTRKDNMEQHRKTHQNGRNPRTSGETRSRAKQPSKKPKPAPLQTEQTVPQQPLPLVDPNLPISPASSFSFSDRSFAPPLQTPLAQELMQPSSFAYPDPSVAAYNPQLLDGVAQLSPGFPSASSGLDTLAMAASGENNRSFDS